MNGELLIVFMAPAVMAVAIACMFGYLSDIYPVNFIVCVGSVLRRHII